MVPGDQQARQFRQEVDRAHQLGIKVELVTPNQARELNPFVTANRAPGDIYL